MSVSGCIELKLWLFGPDNTGFDNSSFPQPDNANDNAPDNANDNGAADVPPVVLLSVSNTQPNVGDQVDLRCSVLPGNSALGVVFAFEPSSARLVVNATAGTAFFIVDATDVGVELRFTCNGTNLAGTGPDSNEVSIFPNSGAAPPP